MCYGRSCHSLVLSSQLIAGLEAHPPTDGVPVWDVPSLLYDYVLAKTKDQPRPVRRLYRALVGFSPQHREAPTDRDAAPVADDDVVATSRYRYGGGGNAALTGVTVLRRGHFGVQSRSQAVQLLSQQWRRRQTNVRVRSETTGALTTARSAVASGQKAVPEREDGVTLAAMHGSGDSEDRARVREDFEAEEDEAEDGAALSEFESSGGSTNVEGTRLLRRWRRGDVSDTEHWRVDAELAGSSSNSNSNSSNRHRSTKSAPAPAVVAVDSSKSDAADAAVVPPPLARRRTVFKWGRQFDFIK